MPLLTPDGRDGMNQVAVAAGKKRREVLRVRAAALVFVAEAEQLADFNDGRAAEGVAHQFHPAVGARLAEIFQGAVFKRISIAGVVTFFRMHLAEIDGAAKK